MKAFLNKIALFTLFIALWIPLGAQVLPVGTPVLEDYYRRLQLLGELDSSISFNVRPLNNAALKQGNIYDPTGKLVSGSGILYSKDSAAMLQIMPVEWKNQFVTTYPYGWNDGPMIPAVGYQTYLSAGVYAKYKFLSVQLRPEFVYAQNKDFEGYDGIYQGNWMTWWRDYANRIDMPERFGAQSYTRLLPGQSSIRFNFHPMSIGVSTENLWWGPGMRNTLLMSNTAPGFLHATINTTKPIHTWIGSFEGQLIGGKLESSGFDPKVLSDNDFHEVYYDPKSEDWRYFSGLVLSYQPKWVKGLSLGLINVFNVNSNDMGNKLGDYIPFFPSNSSSPITDPDNPLFVSDLGAEDRNLSVFARWSVPDANFEIYGEYARNDHSWDARDFVVLPNHSRSYVVGFRKIIPLRRATNDMIQINGEVTHQEPPRTVTLRNTNPMYMHHIVRNGYTNLGQLLGAGVGLGNNLQHVNISWIRGMKQLGFQLERLVHNNDFLYRTARDARRHWVDLGGAIHGEWDYKNFLFTGRMQLTKAYNYQYQLQDIPDSDDFWTFRKMDNSNFFIQLGTMYRF